MGPDRVGPALTHAAGDPGHWRQLQQQAVARSLRLTPGGLYATDGALIGSADADTVYRSLDLQPVPAEQRDGTDEVALAGEGRLPRWTTCVATCTTTRTGLATVA